MKRVGIVGSEGAKFTPQAEKRAKAKIRELLTQDGVTEVVSGGCHLGGIDIWAEEIGRELGLIVTVYKPARLSWEYGYKPRNLSIAHRSDEIHCITVDVLPPSFKGMRFDYCYHCGTKEHVKSGGCWTVKAAMKLGTPGFWHVIRQDEEDVDIIPAHVTLPTRTPG